MISVTISTTKVRKGLKTLARTIKDFAPVADDWAAHIIRRWTLSFPATAGHNPAPAGGPPGIQGGHLRGSLT